MEDSKNTKSHNQSLDKLIEEKRRHMSGIARWLDKQHPSVLTIYAMIAAFLGYMSMYAFRKPWSALSYSDIESVTILGVAFNYKVIAAISQLLGYMGSKFLGIKFASEAPMHRRVPIVVCLILFAELMLLAFALTPAPYNLTFLLLNGLPLGMVWSMLFGIVEGRRCTEFLGLGMSVSVIFASAWVKDVGRWTMSETGPFAVEAFWMPFVTGLVFIPLLALSMFMLKNVPPPNQADIAERTDREPMSRADRKAFVRKNFLGIFTLVFGYALLMGYRNVRDDFMVDILSNLGYSSDKLDFGSIENWVGLAVIGSLCILWLFKNNRAAVWANLVFITIGAIIVGVSTIMVTNKILEPKTFMIINGIGLYMAFVPYQSIFMDRLLASMHTVATASFLIALGDSYGYLTVLGTYILKDIYPAIAVDARGNPAEINWAQLLNIGSYAVLIGVPICSTIIALYFNKKLKA